MPDQLRPYDPRSRPPRQPREPREPRPPRKRSEPRQPLSPTARRRMVRRALLNARRARRMSRRQRVGAVMISVAVAAFLVVWGGGQVALAMLDSAFGGVPAPKQTFADSMVYDRSGQLLAVLHPQGDSRIPVSLDRIATTAQQATVDVEDKGFWTEGAVDLGRVASAAWADVLHHSTQGASTITMQLAKVRYLTDTGGLTYKLRQLLIARHLDASMSKQQILDEYLNDIYYGHGATGIEAAAHTFFSIEASKLDLAESAMLAGLPNQPTDLDPLRFPDAAKERQKQVLDAMVAAGTITAGEAADAAAEPLKYSDGNMDNVNLVPAFVNRVIAEVKQKTGRDATTAGLRITGTLDLAMQQYAQSVVTQQVDAIRGLNVSDGAMVSLDPQSGDVLVYVGGAGAGHPGSEIDMASSPRQPGSTFKLFTYSTALRLKKVTELTPITDAPITVKQPGQADWKPNNYDMRWHGTLPLEEAFSNSFNIPAIKVEQLAGVSNVLATARAMGVTTLAQADNAYGPSLTLGTYPVPLWQMAQAGSVFAAGGMLHPATFVTAVKDSGGRELLPAAAQPKQALDPGVAFIVNDILTNDANRAISFGRGSALTLPNHLVSAKTGTTENFRDNLTVGWTPHLVTATWVGNTDNAPMHGTTGITGAAPIWHAFMNHQLQGVPDDWPGPPADVKQQSLGGHTGWFLDGTGPTTAAGLNQQGCRTWSFNGGNYYWCGGGASTLPGDPGAGAGASPAPLPPGGHHHHG